jgi:hypothetical protein
MLPLHSTCNFKHDVQVVTLENACLIHIPFFFFFLQFIVPFCNNRVQNHTINFKGRSRFRFSMVRKPREINLGSMVKGPTKELAKAKIFVFKILRGL